MALLKLDLNRILDRGDGAEVVKADVDLRFVHYRGVSPFQEPVLLTAEARNRVGVVTLDCTYQYTLHLSCDRCLTPFSKQVTLHAAHTVVRSLSSESSDDDDYLVAPDGIVDLDEVATNDVLPELPGKFLCREDCKGLCPVCGCNLNEGSCGCERREADPRLAILDQFFEN